MSPGPRQLLPAGPQSPVAPRTWRPCRSSSRLVKCHGGSAAVSPGASWSRCASTPRRRKPTRSRSRVSVDIDRADVLVDDVHADRAADGLRLAAHERVAEFDRPEQCLGQHAGIGDRRPRPGISEGAGEAQALRDRGACRAPSWMVCCSLKSEVLKTDSEVRSPRPVRPNTSPRSNPPQRPSALRAAVLDDKVDIGGQALDGDVADDVARRGSGRAER